MRFLWLSTIVVLMLPATVRAYDLPKRDSDAYDRQILQPARQTCQILGQLVVIEQHREAVAKCFGDAVRSCERLYAERGFC
jgi:hypothetical protein